MMGILLLRNKGSISSFSQKERFVCLSCVFFYFVVYLFILPLSVQGQCKGSAYYVREIANTYRPHDKDIKAQLQSLLKLREQMNPCRQEQDSAFSYLLQKIGTLHYHLGEYDSSIRFTQTANRVIRAKYGMDERFSKLFMDNYYNLFYYYREKGDAKQETQALNQWISLFLKTEYGNEQAPGAFFTRAEQLFNKGEYSLLIEFCRLGEALAEREGTVESDEYLIYFMMKQANALYYLKNISAAKAILEQVIHRFQKGQNSIKLGPTYSMLAGLYMKEGQTNRALHFFREAFVCDSLDGNREGCAQNLVWTGSLLAGNLHQYKSGIQYCLRALPYGVATDSMLAFKTLADIYALKHQFDSADYYFDRAFHMIAPGLDENKILQHSFKFPDFNQLQDASELIRGKADSYFLRYKVLKSASYLKEAISLYKKNDLFLLKVKNEQELNFQSNLVWSTVARQLYENALRACFENEDLENAFYFFEKSRAILLNDQIYARQRMSYADLRRENVLKTELAVLKKKLGSLKTGTDSFIAHQKAFCLTMLALKDFDKEVNIGSTKGQFLAEGTPVVSVQTFRKNILAKNQSLLEIFWGDSTVFLLRISKDSSNFLELKSEQFRNLVESFNSYVSDRTKTNRDFNGFLRVARALFQSIFPKLPPGDRLIVSPDGSHFPFEALVIGGNEEPIYLLSSYAVSYTYSASYLANVFSEKKLNNSLLSVAPVRFDEALQLSGLPGSEESIHAIERNFVIKSRLVGKNATRSDFLEQFPAYDIVQLYTHGTVLTSHYEPVIYFVDSPLYLSGLLPDRNPVTRLVVLSACETGVGKNYEGEGIFSFNRGFAALGIPAAISTMWSVDNRSTYRISELFYDHLAKGYPTDLALQKAKLEFLKTSASREQQLPYFWAGMVLTGKTEVLLKKSPLPVLPLLLLAAVLASGIAVYKFKKARKEEAEDKG